MRPSVITRRRSLLHISQPRLRVVLLMLLLLAMFLLYLSYLRAEEQRTSTIGGDLDMIEAKIQHIEEDLRQNHQTIGLIKNAVRDLSNGDMDALKVLQDALSSFDQNQAQPAGGSPVGGAAGRIDQHISSRNKPLNYTHKRGAEIYVREEQICALNQQTTVPSDIQMMDVFEELPFDNPDGGAWKQGYNIQYSDSDWSPEDKLHVFVVPHSHTDPGWIKTFEHYYSEQTRQILNNALTKLQQYPKMRFIYAEMSFFYLWWNEIDAQKQDAVRRLLREGRWELVTAGWVMPDEANSHYYAIVDQLIEGNQWMHNHMNYTPVSGWAIDPFGHSSTMPYLLNRAGLENMLIQRTHYTIKKYLSKKQQLEFIWRQNWDPVGHTDMFTHMMPFYSYDVPHTCGPDPSVCCQFDFKRLPGGGIRCPWAPQPVAITENNVAERAKALLDQYRKKSKLYKNNVLFVPLGDDFRYMKSEEWDNQYHNYDAIMNYINNNAQFNAKVEFGTLSDYFRALRQKAGTTPSPHVGMLPVAHPLPNKYPYLAGDFFSYADRDDHYWTGYFTSRPFYKGLDRTLETNLRSAELLFSRAVLQARSDSSNTLATAQCIQKLTRARRALGLFQHHDGITGTSKDPVVMDYGKKLLEGLQSAQDVIRYAAEFLLATNRDNYHFDENDLLFDVEEVRANHDSVPVPKVIQVTSKLRPVVLYNSLSHDRTTVIQLTVDQPSVAVQDVDGEALPVQINPVWVHDEMYSDDRYLVEFIATVPAYSLYTVFVSATPVDTTAVANIEVYNNQKIQQSGHFTMTQMSGSRITVDTEDLAIEQSTTTGLLQSMTHKASGQSVSLDMEFLYYGTTTNKDKSGAYLFLPGGSAVPLTYVEPTIKVIRGPISTQIQVALPVVKHTVTVYNSPGLEGQGIHIDNLVDITSQMNKELTMRIKSSIKNHNSEFYTDLNAFQMQKRKPFSKLPLQANFYPMTAQAYIEDSMWRLNLLTGQSLGVAGLKQGWLEVIQDRRLAQDDNRGVGQGVRDNKLTPNHFILLLEKFNNAYQAGPKKPIGYPSIQAHLTQQQLIHHVHVLPSNPRSTLDVADRYLGLQQQLPCDLYLLNLRTLPHPESDATNKHTPRKELALLLHRLGTDCSLPLRGVTCSVNDDTQISLADMFSPLTLHTVQERSLSLLHKGADVPTIGGSASVQVPPMEIKTYQITFT